MAELKIKADSNGGTVSLKGPATTTGNAAIQLTLPVDDGTANQYLKTDGSGALSWDTVAVGGASGTDYNDNVKIQLGTGNDSEFYYSGTDNYFNLKNGKTFIRTGDEVRIQNDGETETIAKFIKDGACELYHNNTLSFSSGANGVVMPSGKGIDFSATGDGSGTDTSELLDDYEEGEWTPVINTNAGAISNYSYQHGRYCRVGQLCYVSLFVAGASNSGLENGGSDLWITGVPYAPASFPDAHIFQWCQVNMGGESGYDSHYIGAEYYNDRFYIYGKTAGGNYGAAMGSVLTATSNVIYRGTFRLA